MFGYLYWGAGSPSGKNTFTVNSSCTGTTIGKLGISLGSNEFTLKSSRSENTQTTVLAHFVTMAEEYLIQSTPVCLCYTQ